MSSAALDSENNHRAHPKLSSDAELGREEGYRDPTKSSSRNAQHLEQTWEMPFGFPEPLSGIAVGTSLDRSQVPL